MALANYRVLERNDLDKVYNKLSIEIASLNYDLEVYRLIPQHDIEVLNLETELFLRELDLKLLQKWYQLRCWELPKISL